MLDIILIDFSHERHAFFPLGHMTIKRYLERNPTIAGSTRFTSKVVDMSDEQSIVSLLRTVQRMGPRLISLSCSAENIRHAGMLSKDIRKVHSHTLIVAGGVGVQMDEFLEKNINIDIAVQGEGEPVFEEMILALIEGADVRHVRGIAYRDKGRIISNAPMPQLRNLDHLPLTDIREVRGYRSIYPEWQRGCAFQCAYCCQGNKHHGVRKVPIPQMKMALMKAKEQNVQEAYLIGADINMDKEYMRKLVGILKEVGIPRVKTFMRPEFIDEEIIDLAEQGNFDIVSVGLQSADDSVLRNVDRVLDRKKFSNALDLLEDAKFKAYQLDIILSLPGSNIFKTMFSFAYAARVGKKQRISAFPLHVFPGTPLYSKRREFGIKIDYNYICIETGTQSFVDIAKERCFSTKMAKEKMVTGLI